MVTVQSDFLRDISQMHHRHSTLGTRKYGRSTREEHLKKNKSTILYRNFITFTSIKFLFTGVY